MMYCSKSLQCNKELQLYNIYIHQQDDKKSDELNQIMPNYNDLSRRVNGTTNNLKEICQNNISLAQNLHNL